MQPLAGGSRVEVVETEVSQSSDFASWVAAREGALQRLALLLTGCPHQAQDLAQTTLAKLYLAWDRLDDRHPLDAYARRILVNEHRSTWRRGWRQREVSSESPPDIGVPAHEHDDSVATVWAIVKALPPRQRAVIVLRYYEQLAEPETAAVLGISVGTVKSQANRAIASLRTALPEDPR